MGVCRLCGEFRMILGLLVLACLLLDFEGFRMFVVWLCGVTIGSQLGCLCWGVLLLRTSGPIVGLCLVA